MLDILYSFYIYQRRCANKICRDALPYLDGTLADRMIVFTCHLPPTKYHDHPINVQWRCPSCVGLGHPLDGRGTFSHMAVDDSMIHRHIPSLQEAPQVMEYRECSCQVDNPTTRSKSKGSYRWGRGLTVEVGLGWQGLTKENKEKLQRFFSIEVVYGISFDRTGSTNASRRCFGCFLRLFSSPTRPVNATSSVSQAFEGIMAPGLPAAVVPEESPGELKDPGVEGPNGADREAFEAAV